MSFIIALSVFYSRLIYKCNNMKDKHIMFSYIYYQVAYKVVIQMPMQLLLYVNYEL